MKRRHRPLSESHPHVSFCLGLAFVVVMSVLAVAMLVASGVMH